MPPCVFIIAKLMTRAGDMDMGASNRCFKSDLYDHRRVLSVGVKPYIPGFTINCNHRFVKRLEEWKSMYGSLSKEDMTPDVIREHPGNPLAVIEGSDGRDYVMTDKNEGGKHFDDALAKELASDLLWDLGEGLSQSVPGFPEEYFKKFIMVPSDGTEKDYEYDVMTYAAAYEKQNATKIARQQLPKDIKGVDAKGVIDEIMRSEMVVKNIRKVIGYYDLVDGRPFEAITEKVVSDMLAADATHLSGLEQIALSPLFVTDINSRHEIRRNESFVVSTNFTYGYGKLFNEKNISHGPRKPCHLSKLTQKNSVKYIRRLGMVCPSFVGVGGTYVLDGEKSERQSMMVDNQEYMAEKMKGAGKEPFEKHAIYATGHSELSFNNANTDNSGVARFQLFMKTVIDRRRIFPFILLCEMIKSEVCTYIALIKMFFHQLTNPNSYWYEKSEMEPGDATVTVYRRLIETLYPCEHWWKNGVIKSGKR